MAPFRHSSALASLPVATLKNDMSAATTEISCRLDNGHQGAGGAVTIPIEGAGCLVGLRGTGLVESEGATAVELLRGQAAVVPADAGSVAVSYTHLCRTT